MRHVNPQRAVPCIAHIVFLLLMVELLCWTGVAADPPPKQPTPPGTYLNPLGEPPIHLQEPCMLTYSKTYFLFGTASPSEGFHCYESPDLVHWKFDGWAWRKKGLNVASGNLHSPRVFLYQGMFCMLYSARMPTGIRLGLAASVKPQGPYHDLHVPWLELGDGCVAGDVFIDGSKPYLTYTKATTRDGCDYRVIYGVPLSKDLSKITGEPVKLLEPNQRWELAQREVNRCNQDSTMLRLGAKYYLIYSGNDSRSADYALGYAIANQPLGPWTKASENPLLRSQSSIGVMGPGHGSMFRSLDRSDWFMVYDSLVDPTNHPEDRVVNIDRVVLSSNSKLALQGPTRSPQPLPSGSK